MGGAIVLSVGLALAGPTALSALGIATGENVQCAPGVLTITSDGCSGCDGFNLCEASASIGSCTGPDCMAGEDCSFECKSVDGNSTTVIVSVEFSNPPEVSSGEFSTSSNEGIAVGTIDLSSEITTFIMAGGSADEDYPQGKVAGVTLTSDFISSASGVREVVLQNLDLQEEADSLPDFIPTSVELLNLDNTLLSSFPTELGNFTSLHQLFMDYNYITAVDSSDAIDSLVTLSIKSNSLTSFTGVFSNLEYLYLDANNLTSFPSAIFRHSNLKTLNLSGNSFASRTFARNQVEFLNNLDALGLSTSDFSVGLECDDTEQITVHDITLCIDGESESASCSTDSDSTTTTNSSSSTSVIVGVIGGILLVLFVIGLLYIYLRWKRAVQSSQLNYREPNSGEHFCTMDNGLHREQPSVVQTSEQSSLSPNDTIVVATPLSENEGSTRYPATTDTNSSYPSSRTTEEAEARGRQRRFLTIWNDPELLSLQLRASDLKDIKQLGSGEHTTVWLVRYQSTQLLASRRLRRERRTRLHTETFVKEIKLTANIHHPNLVNHVGAAWTTENDLQALFEYMDGGNLRQYLSQASTPVGWTFHKFDIALGVIEAVVYLHSFVPPLVHRDIKSKNVLLSPNVRAKLSDFGASRAESREKSTIAGQWLAPEVIRGDKSCGPAADIYSFGVLLTELAANEIPVSDSRDPSEKMPLDRTILHRAAMGKLHSDVSSTVPALRTLIKRCLSKEPSKRPTATAIANKLRVVQEAMAAVL